MSAIKIILGLGIILACGFYFIKSDINNEIEFDNKRFAHVETKKASSVKNYYYTINGQSVSAARELLHLIEYSDPELIDRSRMSDYLGRLKQRYKLEKISEGSDRLLGQFTQSDIDYITAAVPVNIGNNPGYVIYLGLEGEAEPRSLFSKLEQIRTQL